MVTLRNTTQNFSLRRPHGGGVLIHAFDGAQPGTGVNMAISLDEAQRLYEWLGLELQAQGPQPTDPFAPVARDCGCGHIGEDDHWDGCRTPFAR